MYSPSMASCAVLCAMCVPITPMSISIVEGYGGVSRERGIERKEESGG